MKVFLIVILSFFLMASAQAETYMKVTFNYTYLNNMGDDGTGFYVCEEEQDISEYFDYAASENTTYTVFADSENQWVTHYCGDSPPCDENADSCGSPPERYTRNVGVRDDSDNLIMGIGNYGLQGTVQWEWINTDSICEIIEFDAYDFPAVDLGQQIMSAYSGKFPFDLFEGLGGLQSDGCPVISIFGRSLPFCGIVQVAETLSWAAVIGVIFKILH